METNVIAHKPRTERGHASQETQEQSITTLLKELSNDGSRLLSQQMSLLKTEMSEKSQILSSGVKKAFSGALVLHLGAVIFTFGIAEAVTDLMIRAGFETFTPWTGYLMVGLVVMLIGYPLAKSGAEDVSFETLEPEETFETVKSTTEWAKRKIS